MEYSSRFAVAYFFDKSKVTWPFTWTCQYFDKGDVRYVAHDSAKRHSTHETMISVLVHSGVPLGIELQDEEEGTVSESVRCEFCTLTIFCRPLLLFLPRRTPSQRPLRGCSATSRTGAVGNRPEGTFFFFIVLSLRKVAAFAASVPGEAA